MRDNESVVMIIRQMRREEERREEERRERYDIENTFGMVDIVSYLTARGVDIHGSVLA